MCLKNMETKLLQMQMEYKEIQTNVINLDDYQLSQGNHTSILWIFLTLQQIYKSSDKPYGSIGVKYKQSNVFSVIFEVANKKIKSFVMLWNTWMSNN